eukprot:scaffold37478_cov176-Amphora_coffeaeformis.AAC.3
MVSPDANPIVWNNSKDGTVSTVELHCTDHNSFSRQNHLATKFNAKVDGARVVCRPRRGIMKIGTTQQ